MYSQEDFRPKSNPSDPTKRPKAWLSARDAVVIGAKNRRWGFSDYDIVRRAAAGQVRSWARRLVVGDTTWGGGEISAKFWEEFQFGKMQDWNAGDFEISVGGRFQVEASGVSFYLSDLEMLFPKCFSALMTAKKQPVLVAPPSSEIVAAVPAKGGRKPSASWPLWVAELVAHVHENGIPEGTGTSGVDAMLTEISNRLATRGFEGPARTTTQDAMRAVLLRMREAGN